MLTRMESDSRTSKNHELTVQSNAIHVRTADLKYKRKSLVANEQKYNK